MSLSIFCVLFFFVFSFSCSRFACFTLFFVFLLFFSRPSRGQYWKNSLQVPIVKKRFSSVKIPFLGLGEKKWRGGLFFHLFLHVSSFFSEERFLLFSFLSIFFVGGISVRIELQMFPPLSVLRGDVVS